MNIFLLVIFLNGCNINDALKPLQEEPFIIGKVSEIKLNQQNNYSVKIVADQWKKGLFEDEHAMNFMWMNLNHSSEILLQTENGTLTRINAEQLEPEQLVQGWPRGNVIITLYPSARAQRIVVISE